MRMMFCAACSISVAEISGAGNGEVSSRKYLAEI